MVVSGAVAGGSSGRSFIVSMPLYALFLFTCLLFRPHVVHASSPFDIPGSLVSSAHSKPETGSQVVKVYHPWLNQVPVLCVGRMGHVQNRDNCCWYPCHILQQPRGITARVHCLLLLTVYTSSAYSKMVAISNRQSIGKFPSPPCAVQIAVFVPYQVRCVAL